MSQVAFTVRMDSATKSRFEELCEQFGMSITTAINVFAKSVIQTRSIPFEIKADTRQDIIDKGKLAIFKMRESAQRNGLSDMTLEEINEEIHLSREGK